MYKSGNNKGRGWNYKFTDGHEGWTMGMSRNELRYEEKRHGKLVQWSPAK